MDPNRRNFLRVSATATGFTLCGLPIIIQNTKRQTLKPPAPADSLPHVEPGRSIDPRATRLFLEQRERDFRESLGQLTDRVAELGHDVSQIDSVNFFSVRLYKQTDAIEHLAKRLKSLAKT
jgi:hypothetical protein